MRIYTCYTPSHRGLLEEHFVPSLPKSLTADNFGARPLPQQSTTGAWARDPKNRAALSESIKEGLRRVTENGCGPNDPRFDIVLRGNSFEFSDDLSCSIRIHGLSCRAQNVLIFAKVRTLQELRAASVKTMKTWKNCGAKTITELLEFRK